MFTWNICKYIKCRQKIVCERLCMWLCICLLWMCVPVFVVVCVLWFCNECVCIYVMCMWLCVAICICIGVYLCMFYVCECAFCMYVGLCVLCMTIYDWGCMCVFVHLDECICVHVWDFVSSTFCLSTVCILGYQEVDCYFWLSQFSQSTGSQGREWGLKKKDN